MYLESYEDGVCFADETDHDGTLLHGLTGIFDLEDSSLWRALGLLATLKQVEYVVKLSAYKVTESLS